MDFRASFSRDFGVDVHIGKGSGSSADDPVEVLDDNDRDADTTEMLFLRCLGLGRGVMWKTLSAEPVEHGGAALVKRRVLLFIIGKEQIERRVEAFYFARIHVENPRPATNFHVFQDGIARIGIPYELGVYHYDGFTDNAKDSIWLGYSVAYSTLMSKATLFVYPVREAGLPGSAALEAEMEQARRDACALSGPGGLARDWGVRKEGDSLLNFFVPRQDETVVSGIVLALKNGHFVKLRLTFTDEELTREAAQDFVAHVLALLSPGGEGTGAPAPGRPD